MRSMGGAMPGGRVRPVPSGELIRAWRVVLYAAIAEVTLAVAGLALYVITATDPRLRLPVVLVQSGYVLLRSLVAYGVYYRVRWAAWIGGILAAVTAAVALAQVLGFVAPGAEEPAAVGGIEFYYPRLVTLHLWAGVVADLAFLVGLAMVKRVRRQG